MGAKLAINRDIATTVEPNNHHSPPCFIHSSLWLHDLAPYGVLTTDTSVIRASSDPQSEHQIAKGLEFRKKMSNFAVDFCHKGMDQPV